MPPRTSPPAYVQTALPVLLDLQNRNTRDQIQSGVSRPSHKTAAQESKEECARIMQVSGHEFLDKRQLCQPGTAPLSREEDVPLFWEWVREFHGEYNEDWFTRNMPRLKQEFLPMWRQVIRERMDPAKASGSTASPGAPTSSDGTAAVDLLSGDLLETAAGSSASVARGGSSSSTRLRTDPASASSGNTLDDLLGGVTSDHAQPPQLLAPTDGRFLNQSSPAEHDLLSLVPEPSAPAAALPSSTSAASAPSSDLLELQFPTNSSTGVKAATGSDDLDLLSVAFAGGLNLSSSATPAVGSGGMTTTSHTSHQIQDQPLALFSAASNGAPVVQEKLPVTAAGTVAMPLLPASSPPPVTAQAKLKSDPLLTEFGDLSDLLSGVSLSNANNNLEAGSAAAKKTSSPGGSSRASPIDSGTNAMQLQGNLATSAMKSPASSKADPFDGLF
ncbi:unnamed protein product [Amoebophrya sp. A120]|nr:unnamed protein product [Amoebophrya sp. A120]|eukprot:GSA120T00018005001.1